MRTLGMWCASFGLALLLSGSIAEAGVFSSLGRGGVFLWNLLPQVVTVVNTGVHLVCDTLCGHPADGAHTGVCGAVHSTMHTVADALMIERLP